jgi:hypothetical protein
METWIGEEEIREKKKWKEEINPEDDENGKLTGDCSRRSSLPAGGDSSPATASGGARAGGRLVECRAAPACVRPSASVVGGYVRGG